MWWITGLSLLFLFSALVALAVVPVYLNRELSLLQDRVQTILAPAERYAAQIELSQTNRNAALEAYLFSGNSTVDPLERGAPGSSGRGGGTGGVPSGMGHGTGEIR